MLQFGPAEIMVMGPAAVAASFLIWNLLYRTTSREDVDEWARRHGVSVTDSSRPMVAGYLNRSREFRLRGALVGLVVPFGIGVPGVEMATGFLAGILLAELTYKRPEVGDKPAGELPPRTLSIYLPSWVTRLLHGISLFAVLVLLPLYLWGPKRPGPDTFQVSALLGGLAVVVVPWMVEALLKRMVARPQAAVSEELVRIDDAIRAYSIHSAAGAGLCTTLLLLATFTAVNGITAGPPFLQWILPAAGALIAVSCVIVWTKLGQRSSWKVSRRFGARRVRARSA